MYGYSMATSVDPQWAKAATSQALLPAAMRITPWRLHGSKSASFQCIGFRQAKWSPNGMLRTTFYPCVRHCFMFSCYQQCGFYDNFTKNVSYKLHVKEIADRCGWTNMFATTSQQVHMQDRMQVFKSASKVTNAFQNCKWVTPFGHLPWCIGAIQSYVQSVQQELITNLMLPCQQKPFLSHLLSLRTPLPVPPSVASFTHDFTSTAMAMQYIKPFLSSSPRPVCVKVSRACDTLAQTTSHEKR